MREPYFQEGNAAFYFPSFGAILFHMKHLGYRSHKPKIYIGTDHAGFAIKEKLVPFLKKLGYEVVDCGDYKYNPTDDFPFFISKVAKAVALNPDDHIGIILGGSGQGEAIIANRYPHVRAAVYYGEPGFFTKLDIVKLSREHNDSNILSLGARFLNVRLAKKAVKEWLATPFSGEERHRRRIKEIETISREVKNNFDFK
jgi:ribose 5-phosphate isomerase B